MPCDCDPKDPYEAFLLSAFRSPKEDQKAKVEAQPVLKAPFEQRVVDTALKAWRSRPSFLSYEEYTWSQALSDATDITLASDFECSIEEITND